MKQIADIIKAANIDISEIDLRERFLQMSEEDTTLLMELTHLILPVGEKFVDELYEHIHQFHEVEQLLPKNDAAFARLKKINKPTLVV